VSEEVVVCVDEKDRVSVADNEHETVGDGVRDAVFVGESVTVDDDVVVGIGV
jgi:hypothetical protein